jgi:hypothetical protein
MALMPEDNIAHEASVLLVFRADNVRSFRDEFTFSLLATALAEQGVARSIAWREGGKPIDVLPVAGVFGANASGKSNVLRAMSDMRAFVLHSFRHGSPTGGLPQHPFRLDPGSASRPSRFEVDIVLSGVRHQYGFSVDSERVIDEWAVRFPKGRAVRLFSREGDAVEVGTVDRARTRAVTDLLRSNALFLSTAASTNHPTLLPLYGWFERNMLLAEASSRDNRQALTTTMLGDPDLRDRVLEFLQAADLGVTDAVRKELDPKVRERLERAVRVLMGQEGDDPEGPANRPMFDDTYGIQLAHKGSGNDVAFEPSDESLGTLVWFGLVGPVIQALRDGGVLLADELDASLHPVLVAHLISLFQNPETNRRRAQLIFNSHDTTILGESAAHRVIDVKGSRLLGRDQVWFTEKTNDGATHVYPLTDLDPRKDESVERRYLAGRYGATPIISRARLDATAQLVTNGASAER